MKWLIDMRNAHHELAMEKAPQIAASLEKIPGFVQAFSGELDKLLATLRARPSSAMGAPQSVTPDRLSDRAREALRKDLAADLAVCLDELTFLVAERAGPNPKAGRMRLGRNDVQECIERVVFRTNIPSELATAMFSVAFDSGMELPGVGVIRHDQDGLAIELDLAGVSKIAAALEMEREVLRRDEAQLVNEPRPSGLTRPRHRVPR